MPHIANENLSNENQNETQSPLPFKPFKTKAGLQSHLRAHVRHQAKKEQVTQ